MARFFVHSFPLIAAITVIALVVIGLTWLLSPELRRRRWLHVISIIGAIVLLVEVLLIPALVFALIEDFHD